MCLCVCDTKARMEDGRASYPLWTQKVSLFTYQGNTGALQSCAFKDFNERAGCTVVRVRERLLAKIETFHYYWLGPQLRHSTIWHWGSSHHGVYLLWAHCCLQQTHLLHVRLVFDSKQCSIVYRSCCFKSFHHQHFLSFWQDAVYKQTKASLAALLWQLSYEK